MVGVKRGGGMRRGAKEQKFKEAHNLPHDLNSESLIIK
jgi:hypothetical protein